jgi:acyl-ACP thioesterase
VSDADALLAPQPGVRVYEIAVRPGLSDCAPSGRARLDALARWLQDVAYADVEDAGLAQAAVWVVRRMRLLVHRFPRFGERCSIQTFCSGIGRMWAERRSSVLPLDGEDRGPLAEAVALWVHLDPEGRRPTPLTEGELRTYGATGTQRRVTARLRHPAAPALGSGAIEREWRFRHTDCDLADHVNNAAYWQPLEEELLSDGEPHAIDVEIEFRVPAQPGLKRVLAEGAHRWIVEPEQGTTIASVLVRGQTPQRRAHGLSTG